MSPAEIKKCPSVKVACMMQTPNLAEWWSSLFTLGLGMVMVMWPGRLSMGLLQGNVVEAFQPYGLLYSWMVLVAGLLGLYGIARKRRLFRMGSAMALFASLGWLSLYYYWSVPIPWQGVWVYAAHAALEGAIFVRVQHSLDKGWT